MDLNVYEDDDDETLHKKLIAAKIARKRAEEDHKLLSNRIALLKQEEQKVSVPLTTVNRPGRNSTRPRNAPMTSSVLASATSSRPPSVLRDRGKRKRRRPSARCRTGT